MRSLGRMLAAVDYEPDEDRRVFGCTRAAPAHYENLCEAARNVVDTYRREQEQKPPESGGTKTPSCEDCRHYEASVRDVVCNDDWELLTTTHGIRPEDCCHPTALIAHGSGAHAAATSARRTFCGHRAVFYARLDDSERLTRRRIRIEQMMDAALHHSALVEVDIEGLDGTETIVMGKSQVRRLGMAPGTTLHARAAKTAHGELSIEDWEP